MWKEDKLLELMQTNYEIFGKKILNIKKAKQEWLINYFENKLYYMLDMFVALTSEYAREEMDCYGNVHDKEYYKKFNLTSKQCVEIFAFIYPRYFIKDKAVRLNKWDSEIILNYIEKGYRMQFYKLTYYGEKNND